ncbi:hypothetical protein EV130_108284 [Rhizobium azibense]|uniref:Uncharacterized protein n=1 Tax=Rhizobium azibense TaxID=1136135 RepID=A0A4R3QPV2_9HYPH|nr:hypothetical protein EV130_108284 [Rhizobium azibense]TCU36717.1 hypothetical protein EV129_107285 [Rhizobium azibense]
MGQGSPILLTFRPLLAAMFSTSQAGRLVAMALMEYARAMCKSPASMQI